MIHKIIRLSVSKRNYYYIFISILYFKIEFNIQLSSLCKVVLHDTIVQFFGISIEIPKETKKIYHLYIYNYFIKSFNKTTEIYKIYTFQCF